MDESEQKDLTEAQRAFDRFLVAPYENDIHLTCDRAECGDVAEWFVRCNSCTGVGLICAPHYNSIAVADRMFGFPSYCSACHARGPLAVAFTTGLLRSPS